jgi:hypothetical protein
VSADQAERYRQAAENALRQLDWCIDYFRRIHEGRLSAQLANNTAHIRRSLLQEARKPTKRRRKS